MLDLATLTDRLDDGSAGGLLVTYRSPQLCLATGRSDQIQSIVDDLGSSAHYYLSAGTGRFARPPWCFGDRPAVAAPAAMDWILVEQILNHRENRHAAIERALGVVDPAPDPQSRPTGGAPTAGAPTGSAPTGSAPTVVVMETMGRPTRDDVVFLQACRLRLGPPAPARSSLILLRHTPVSSPGSADAADPANPADAAGPANAVGRAVDARADEVLLSLLLAGGCAAAVEFDHWSRTRGWAADVVAAATSTRLSGPGRLYTYASAGHRRRAGAAAATADPARLAELAALVVSTQAEPLIATAALVPDPAVAVAAFAGLARAHDDGLRDVLAYGKRLFHDGRRGRWTAVSKQTAGTLLLAALAARGEAVSPAAVPALLNLAERFDLDPEVRSGLAYHLGQGLAKGVDARSWAAGVRCFEYARDCLRRSPSVDPVRDRSRLAASHNGAALALFRGGDRPGAVTAELAGLAVLSTSDAPSTSTELSTQDALSTSDALATSSDDSHLRDQRILLLANVAKVHRAAGSAAEALDCYRRAWRIAAAAESMPGTAYVAADLVRGLVAAGELDEARSVAQALLRLHDRTGDPSRNVERAIVGACCTLADASPDEATLWYVEAVRRMRRGAPRLVEAIIANLRRKAGAAPQVIAEFERELVRHQEMARDLTALSELVEEGSDDD